MLLEEIKAVSSEKRDLRNFGIALGVFTAILGGVLWYTGKDTYQVLLVISAASLVLCFTVPIVLKPLQKVAMIFAVIMGWFMTRVILSILFYLVFTFIGVARFFGKEFIALKMDRSKKSYWLYREQKPFEKERYEKQF